MGEKPAKPIILSADSTCDLSAAICQQYQIHINPCLVVLDDIVYDDGVNMFPSDIFNAYNTRHILATTVATNSVLYKEYLQQYKGCSVIHFTIASGISSANQNCTLAGSELEDVHIINSKNLSTGIGLQVIETARKIAAGLPVEQIVAELRAETHLYKTAFILDDLEFLYKGGRCSALAMMGANLLKLRPCIASNHEANGALGVAKKYRGSFDAVIDRFTREFLQTPNLDPERVFITYSSLSEERLERIRSIIREKGSFIKHVEEALAGASVAAHCGPNTVGFGYKLLK